MRNFQILFCLGFIILCNNASASLNYSDTLGFGGAVGAITPAPWSGETERPSGPNNVTARPPAEWGPRLSVWARYHHKSPNIGWELAYDHLNFSENDIQSNAFTAALFWRYFVDTAIQPIWAFGFGLSKTKRFYDSGDLDLPIFKIRFGVDLDIRPQMTLGLYLDHFSIFKNKDVEPVIHALAPSLAVNYYFGGVPFSIPAAKEESKPAEAVAAKADVQKDLDSDGDGVPDSADKCPGSAIGAKVNALGCAIKQSFSVQLDVKFASGSNTLDTASLGDIEELGSIMKQNQDLKIVLEGHTDNLGKAAKNTALSKARAEAVKQELVRSHGINGNRISVKGLGGSKPVASNATEAGRAANRRVVAQVIR